MPAVRLIASAMAGICCAAHLAAAQSKESDKRQLYDPVVLTVAQTAAVEGVVKEQLRDPYSARFERLRGAISVANAHLEVCGYVNAKNLYGGYVGKKLFHVWFAAADKPGSATVSIEKLDDANETTVHLMCRYADIVP